MIPPTRRNGLVASSLGSVAPKIRWTAILAIALALLFAPEPPPSAYAQATEAYSLLATWPVGNGPERVVVAPGGDVYVLVAGGSRIERRSPAGVVLDTVSVVGAREFAVDDIGSLYTVSGLSDRVDKYAANGPLTWSKQIPAFGPVGTPSGTRPPHGSAIVWNPVLERATVPYDFGNLESGLEFHLRTYTRGGVDAAGFVPAGTSDTYGDAAAKADAIHLLNRTRGTIEVYRNGSPAGQVALAEPSDRIAAGADGSHFAVARRRWVYKYGLSGELLAVWDALDVNPDPFADSMATDVDVDTSGNVYVADPARNQVRVYGIDPDPSASPGPLPARADLGCQVFPDKFADPTRLRLGQQTKVTLRLDGGCPEVSERADIMLVVDTSGSMQGDKLTAAKNAIETFMVLKDVYSPPGRDRVGLAAFDIVSRLVVPLTEDSSALIGAARGLTAYGGTDIGAGIDEAVRELTGPRRRVDAQPIIVLMTDGTPTSVTGAASLAAADRARYLTAPAGCYSAGTCSARLYAIGLGGDVDQDFLRIVATTPDQYYFAPDPSRLAEVYSTIARRIYATELLKSVRIVDRIPGNMTYVADSAVPPTARYDRAAHSLTWDLGIVSFAGTELSYWLLPEEVGEWPTNIVATYDGPDGLGEPQLGEFPIPVVIVEDDTPTPSATVPSATPTAPPTGSSSPTHTPPPTNTPSSTPSPPTWTLTPTPVVPTATTPPTVTPSPTPGRYSIYVVIVYNNVCFKRYTDVALVIDASTTMLRKDAGGEITKLEAARAAARTFLDQLTLEPDRHGRHDQASIVWFNKTAAIEQPLTADRTALDGALDRVAAVEGSRIDLGITSGHEAVSDTARHVPANAPVVVLLSDGIPNQTTFEAIFGAADAAKGDGTLIYTAGHGLDVQEWALRRVASQPEDYFYAPNAGQMNAIYRQIAGQVVCR